MDAVIATPASCEVRAVMAGMLTKFVLHDNVRPLTAACTNALINIAYLSFNTQIIPLHMYTTIRHDSSIPTFSKNETSFFLTLPVTDLNKYFTLFFTVVPCILVLSSPLFIQLNAQLNCSKGMLKFTLKMLLHVSV
jgi:hypothetical protein